MAESLALYFEKDRCVREVEKDMGVQHWVYITIESRDTQRNRCIYHHYDLPRAIAERWDWVIRWRRARCQNQHPRENVCVYNSFYDKNLGANKELNILQRQIISTKAWITTYTRRSEKYIKEQRQCNMFFDEQTDELLQRARQKISNKEEELRQKLSEFEKIKNYDNK